MIAKVTCSLSHPLHLVISPIRYHKIMADYPDVAPPSEASLSRELTSLAAFGVPTFLDTWSGGDSLRINFCTQRYEISCSPTSQGDGYRVGHIVPLSLRRHNQIARQSVLVKSSGWVIHGENAALNRFSRTSGTSPQSGIDAIKAAWNEAQRLGTQAAKKPVDVSLEHKRFLATVDSLIESTRQVNVNEAARRGSTAVLNVETIVQKSNVGRQYKFLLAASTDLTVDDYVLASVGEPGQRGGEYAGVVREVLPDAVVIHFYQSIDEARLRQVEWLIPFASQKQYDIQSQAVQALREGKGKNEYLMQFIVDGHFQPYQAPRLHNVPDEQLNSAQRQVIASAEVVPDVLLVLGPPGTGKTHTILKIVARQAQAGKRVLVTSKNNKAVDNVLEALSGVRAIRIGRDGKISEAVRPLLIDEKAQALQEEILTKTEPVLASFKDAIALWPQTEHALDCLSHQAAEWHETESQLAFTRHQLALWQKSRYTDIKRAIDRLQQRFHETTLQLTQSTERSRRLSLRLHRLKPLCQIPVLGAVFVLWADRSYAEWQQVMQSYRNCLRDREKISYHRQQVWQTYYHQVTSSEEALQHKQPVAEAEVQLNQHKERALYHFDELRRILACAQLVDLPALTNASLSPPKLIAISEQLNAWYQRTSAKKELLSQWHTRLKTRRRALYPTLIKTADVVGATCIGIATDANFSDLEFDLVIADEAGQIQVMDILVPLVRAQRAVLVGDHQQLPPVVTDEVANETNPDDNEQQAWLRTSLFELLFNKTTPDSHKIMLNIQYRMPQIIADFISRQFYDGSYRTGREVPHTDPFFHSPIVFIDTQSERNKEEQKAIEPEGIRGYINHLEARLIADVVLAYQDHGDEWGVIVPFKKQAERIRAELKRRRGELSSALLEDWVATVDSFQGKERDVIIFGFTRSNSHGQIGFLVELRRLNVSLTRAKQQLVLIGNSTTLTQATDAPFAKLIGSLLETTQSLPGGYIHARELRQRLATIEQ